MSAPSLSELQERTDRVTSLVGEWSTELKVHRSTYEGTKAKMEKLTVDVDLKASAISLLKALSEDVWTQSQTVIESVVTEGLKFVFEEDIKFKADYSTYRNNASVQFLIEKDGKERDIMDSLGGGTVDVASFLLRIAVLLLSPNVSRIVLLDEPAKMLSARYVPKLAEFLRLLGTEFGVQFLIITHNPRLAQTGQGYFVQNIQGKTVVEDLDRADTV